MTDKKLFGLFSGTHLIAAFAIATLAPTALYAVSFTPVAITDSLSGHQAAVDVGRRLYTYDPIAGYGNNPANIFQLSNSCNANAVVRLYSVPTGKAVIIKAIQMSYNEGTSGFDNFVEFYDTNSLVVALTIEDPNVVGSHQANLGNGFIVRAGESVSCYSTVPANVTMQGYFVPASAVPAAGTAEAVQQSLTAGKNLIRGRPQ